MRCTIEQTLIDKTIEFHRHNCPGLTIGIRVSELAIRLLDIQNIPSPVCVTETDMCGVDAIQFITGCSFGKGNLIHKDYGKSAFTFYDRTAGEGFRAVFNNEFAKNAPATVDQIKFLLSADLNDLFKTTSVDSPPVRPARILNSITCDTCKESTMESRVRLYDGNHHCIPCFRTIDQKN